MAKPLSCALVPWPLSEVMQAMPITVIMKSSGEPKVSTSGRTIGIDTASAAAPISAPTSELISAAPSARPASPFFAIGWPSTTVAADRPSPGTPNRIDVMSPVVAATECMPSRKANASTGLILKTKGNHQREGRGAADTGKQADQKPSTCRPASG